MKIRKRLYDHEAIHLGLALNEKGVGRHQARYYVTQEESDLIDKYRIMQRREYVEVLRKRDKSGNVISSLERLQATPQPIPKGHKIIGTTTNAATGHQWIRTQAEEQEFNIKDLDIDGIVSKYINRIDIEPKKIDTEFLFDRLVYTDVHIGMTTNENGHSLYGGKWDEQEIKDTLETMIAHVIENKKSNVLIIDELGDFLDGWDGKTVRRSHELPQNMDNEKAFDVGLYFKIRLIDEMMGCYERVICNNICNDNHAGSFGYVVNSAFKQIAETRYLNCAVNNIRTFISHYFFGDYCFIITHGKDGKNLKFGFKPKLDAKQIETINNYIQHHNINSPYIEFSKGDSHQNIFDESTADNFYYYNYGALSPSSEWVQTNYKKGKRSFQFFNYKDGGQKIHIPFTFEWKINREETFNDYSEV